MTRKDYILLADALRRARGDKPANSAGEHARIECCVRIACALEADNARFDHARFLEDCGVQL